MIDAKKIIRLYSEIIIVLVLALSPVFSQNLTELPKKLTLPQAIDFAIEHNMDIKKQQSEIRVAEAQLEGTLADWRFQLDLTSEYDHLYNTGATQNPGSNADQLYTYLEASQPILTFGKAPNASKGSQVNIELQKTSLKEVMQSVEHEVTVAFYNILLQQELVDVNEKAVSIAAEHLKNAELRLNQGINTKFDVTRSQVDLANRRADLITAQTALEKARHGFNQLLNMPPSTLIQMEGRLEFKEYHPEVEALWEAARKNRPRLLSKQLIIKQNQYQLEYYKAAYSPTVSIGGKYNIEHSKYEDQNDRNFNQWSAYLKITTPLWDGNKAESQIKVSRGYIEQAEYDLNKETLAARTDIEQAILDIDKQKELVETNQSAVELAELSLSMAQYSYENGQGTTLDVTDAELSLRTARSNLANSVNNYLVAMADLKKAVGLDELPGQKD